MARTIEEIRYGNVRLLVDEAGSQSRFAERMEQRRSQVSHYAGKVPIKNIGSAMARRIEITFNRPVGWMDRSNSGGTASSWGAPKMGSQSQTLPKVPSALAKQVEHLVEDFLVAAPAERAAILARAARAAKRAITPSPEP